MKTKTMILTFLTLLSITPVIATTVSETTTTETVPGDFWYFLDRGWEDLTLFFTFDPVHRIKLQLTMAHERILEIKVSIDKESYTSMSAGAIEFEKIKVGLKTELDKLDLLIKDDTERLQLQLKIKTEIGKLNYQIKVLEDEIKLKLKADITFASTPEEQAMIETVMDSLSLNTNELKVTVDNKKEETKIKIRSKLSLTQEEVDDLEGTIQTRVDALWTEHNAEVEVFMTELTTAIETQFNLKEGWQEQVQTSLDGLNQQLADLATREGIMDSIDQGIALIDQAIIDLDNVTPEDVRDGMLNTLNNARTQAESAKAALPDLESTVSTATDDLLDQAIASVQGVIDGLGNIVEQDVIDGINQILNDATTALDEAKTDINVEAIDNLLTQALTNLDNIENEFASVTTADVADVIAGLTSQVEGLKTNVENLQSDVPDIVSASATEINSTLTGIIENIDLLIADVNALTEAELQGMIDNVDQLLDDTRAALVDASNYVETFVLELKKIRLRLNLGDAIDQIQVEMGEENWVEAQGLTDNIANALQSLFNPGTI